jgi:cytochrome c oxidase cbb3-type subunit 3
MPSYGGHLTDAQIWALTEYVRSLTGDTRFDVTAPAREDAMQTYAKRPK